MQRQGRLAGADFMRATACLLVLAHHFVLRLDTARVAGNLRPVFDILRFGNFGVAIFFVLSGFLLARPFWQALDAGGNMPGLRHYAIRRAARLVPGFWLAATAGFVLSITLFAHPATRELVLRYVAGLLFMSQWHWRTFFPVESDGPLWSIPFEATSYVLLPGGFLLLFLIPATRRRPLLTRAAWVGIIAAVLLVHTAICTGFVPEDAGRGWQYGLQGGAKEWMPRFNPIGFFAIFALGALAAGVEMRLPARRSFSFDAAAALALAVAGTRIAISPGGSWEGYGWLDIPYAFPVFPLAIAAALVCLAHSRLLAALLDNALVRYVARISFGIYVWQEIVLLTMKELDPASFGAAETDVLAGWISSCGIAAVLIVMIASLSYYLLEKPVLQSTARLASINGR